VVSSSSLSLKIIEDTQLQGGFTRQWLKKDTPFGLNLDGLLQLGGGLTGWLSG